MVICDRCGIEVFRTCMSLAEGHNDERYVNNCYNYKYDRFKSVRSTPEPPEDE